MADTPDVDVVIPTLNAANVLGRSLDGITRQDYPGRVRVLVLDAGSSDGTQEVARQFNVELTEMRGIYSTGLTGARNRALNLVKGELYWQIDADNFVDDRTSLRRLVRPFAEDCGVNIAFPEVAPSPDFHPLCNWMALEERARTSRLVRIGKKVEEWYLIEDLPFGLCNASLLRTSALRVVGGYDSDVRTLNRMRKRGLSRAAYLPSCHYHHLSVRNPSDLVNKLESRMRRFGEMTPEQLEQYFVDYSGDRTRTLTGTARTVLEAPLRAAWHLLKGGEAEWAWGLAYPALLGRAVLGNPSRATATLGNFL